MQNPEFLIWSFRKQKIIWKTHVFYTGSLMDDKSHLSSQGNQTWKAGDQAGFSTEASSGKRQQSFALFHSLLIVTLSVFLLLPKPISYFWAVPCSPALHTQVSHQTPQHSLAAFLWPEGPWGCPEQGSPSFSTGTSLYPSSFFLLPWRNTMPQHLLFHYQWGHKRQLHEYVIGGIKKFQGLWWIALQFMFNMKAAGAVCVNSYSATVRWLVSPERDSASCIAGNTEN